MDGILDLRSGTFWIPATDLLSAVMEVVRRTAESLHVGTAGNLHIVEREGWYVRRGTSPACEA